jgi:methylenetetrahydrofolate reductase (NADPH)
LIDSIPEPPRPQSPGPESPGSAGAGGGLERRLRAGEFAITAELTPAVSADPEELIARALPLRGQADAVNITDGAGARAHLDVLTAALLLLRCGVEPVLQLTCRDRNRIALQSLLLGAAALGVRNILALKGDDPTVGDQPAAKGVFDVDSNTLIATAARLRDRGELPHGRVVGGSIDFFLGAADAPIDPADDWQPTHLTRKLDAGAQFIQTQFCMDPGVVRRYAARLAEHGVTARAYLLIGLAPLASARSARWIRERLYGSIIPETLIQRLEGAANQKLEGRRICLELMHELREIPGVAGVHLMAPLHDEAVPIVIGEYRAAAARR